MNNTKCIMKVDFLNLLQVNAPYQEEIMDSIQRVVESGWYLRGEETALFEQEFALYCGMNNAVGVGNGLDAITLILMACKELYGWNDEDEVLVPAHTFIATVQAVIRAGLRPVLCEVSEQDYLIDVSKVELRVTGTTRAILPVHLYGLVCDMPKLASIAKRFNLKLIEDAAQSHGGCDSEGGHIGKYSEAVAYSFYPGKNLGAMGDGGAVVTDKKDLARCVRMLANYGSEQKYKHEYIGLNSRLDEIQAAVLRVKLRYLDKDNEQRRKVATCYAKGIQNPLLRIPYEGNTKRSVFHIYPVLCAERDKLADFLCEKSIGTLVHYPIPLHQQSALSGCFVGNFPVTEMICSSELSLPISNVMGEDEIAYVIESINNFRI